MGQTRGLTNYRNERKRIQEERFRNDLISKGFQETSKKISILKSFSDIEDRSFTNEIKVYGSPIQKADFALRVRDRIIFVEAKAIGVLIDSQKREKEISDKNNNWKNHFRGFKKTIAFLSGFIAETSIRSLLDNGIEVIFEHEFNNIRNNDDIHKNWI